jgi:Ca2+/H+ antiporter, TMEM165/GDT1 family
VNLGVLVSAFLAASIEVIEMVAIVVAVGVARSWRSSLVGAAGGLVVLVVLVAVLGTALRNVPLAPLRFAVGSLLLLFGLQWLRKGVFRVARDGWAVGVGDEDVEEDRTSGGRLDWTAFVLSFKGVSLEGLEVAVIVVAFGSAARATGSAAIGAAGAVVLIGALGLATYRAVARIPRRALQLFVGAMLVTFGTFWSGQGLGVSWPGHEFALLWLGAGYLASALVLLRLVMNWRRAALTAAQRPTVSGVQP